MDGGLCARTLLLFEGQEGDSLEYFINRNRNVEIRAQGVGAALNILTRMCNIPIFKKLGNGRINDM